jgi:uncharacterized protein YxjI
MSSPPVPPEEVLATLEAADRILVQQVFKPIANEYRISVPAPDSSDEGRPLLFVKQKKLTIKEDIRFRLDPEREEHLFMIKSKTVYEFRGRHEVLDSAGNVIGTLSKSFGKSLFRSHWVATDASGEKLFESQESNLLVAIVRRFGDLIPYVGWALEYVPFNFVLRREEKEIGFYRRVLGQFRDRYVLELKPGAEAIDRRLVVAFAVALDALQDR